MRVLQPFIIIAICLAGLFSPTALSAAAGNNLPPTSELSAVDISAAPLVASLSIYDNQPSPASATAHLTMYDAMPCMAIANNHPSLINATPPCPNPFLAYATQALNRTYDPQPSYSQIANGTYAYDGLTISAVALKSQLPAQLPAGANNASTRLTQAGEEFVHYGYAEHAAGWQGGARPGTYAGTIEASTGAEAQNIYNLPRWRSPPDSVYIIRPPAGTPVQGPGRVMPAYGKNTSGLSEFIFPTGTPPGSVSGPFPIPPR
jgi:hypothetical protein